MNWWTKAKEFLQETQGEMKKLTFPTRDEVVATTIVVVVTSVVFAVYLYAADFLIQKGYQGLVGVFGS